MVQITLHRNHVFQISHRNLRFHLNFVLVHTVRRTHANSITIDIVDASFFDHKLFDFGMSQHIFFSLFLLLTWYISRCKKKSHSQFVIFGKKILLSEYGQRQRRRWWAIQSTIKHTLLKSMCVDGGFDGESLEFVDLILNLWQLKHFDELWMRERCVRSSCYHHTVSICLIVSEPPCYCASRTNISLSNIKTFIAFVCKCDIENKSTLSQQRSWAVVGVIVATAVVWTNVSTLFTVHG